MPSISTTFQSNLTGSASGSTVSSATTSKTYSTTAGTALNLTGLTQSIATTATSVDLGAIDVTKAYALNFRNLAAASGTTPENNILVLCTVGAADRIVGMIRPGSSFGPIDVPGSAYSGSTAPAGWKLQSVGSTALVAQIIAVQQSDATT